MSHAIVETRYAKMNPFEKLGLYVQIVGDLDAARGAEEDLAFERWLIGLAIRGRNLREIAEAIEAGDRDVTAIDAWMRVDEAVGRLIERGVVRAIRMVVVR